MSLLEEIQRQPWRLEFFGDPFSRSWPWLDVLISRIAAISALVLGAVAAVRRWRRSCVDGAPSKWPLLEIAVLVLWAGALVFVVRSLHREQWMIHTSRFAKVTTGTEAQLEAVDAANAWLPWLWSATSVALMASVLGYARGATSLRGLWSVAVRSIGVGWALSQVAVWDLSLAVSGFTRAGAGLFAQGLRTKIPEWADYVAEKSNLTRILPRVCVLSAVAVLLVVYGISKVSLRNSAKPSLSSWFAGVGCSICLALSGLIVWLSKPVVAELRAPIPIDRCYVNLGLGILPPLSILGEGPDTLRDGPQLVYQQGYWLDGVEAENLDEVYSALRNKFELWRRLNPGRSVPGYVNLAVASPLTNHDLRAVLTSLLRAGFSEVGFMLSQVADRDQPLLGKLRGVRSTAVNLKLTSEAEGCVGGKVEAVAPPAPSAGDATTFVHRLVELRKRGQVPCLALASSPPTNTSPASCGPPAPAAPDRAPVVARSPPRPLEDDVSLPPLGVVTFDETIGEPPPDAAGIRASRGMTPLP